MIWWYPDFRRPPIHIYICIYDEAQLVDAVLLLGVKPNCLELFLCDVYIYIYI